MNIKIFSKTLIGKIYYNFYYKFVKPVGNRVLIYHAFGAKLAHDYYGISISPKLFEEHVKYIRNNFKVLPISHHTFDNCLTENSVSISIDDGYKDTMVGVEILEKHNIPYTIYISTGLINKKFYLSDYDLRQLSLSKFCTLGTHTVNHVSLSKLSKEEQTEELKNSKSYLEDVIGKEVVDFSYPYGNYDNSSKTIADSIYSLISTSNIGMNCIASCDKKMIKRIEITAKDDMNNLKRKILGYYDFL